MANTTHMPAPDVPVSMRNGAKRDAIKAASTIRTLIAEKGTLAALERDLAHPANPAQTGHKFNRGYLSNVMHGKRAPSKELLIALGIRKPPKVLTNAERQARKATREIQKALWLLYSAAESGHEVRIVRAGVIDGWWSIDIYNLSGQPQKSSEYQASFVDAVQDVTK